VHGDQRRVGGFRRVECSERVVGVAERRAQASDIELRGLQVALEMIGLAFVDGGIELDQHIPGIDVLAVRDPYGAYHAGLEGLDHLAVAGRDDLPGGGGHDIHMAQAGPGQSQHEEGDQGRADRPADGRGRGFDDFERRRQERELVAVPLLGSPREGHDFLFRFHEIPPKQERESDAAMQDRERAGEDKAAPG
jgi:hypothetical protein